MKKRSLFNRIGESFKIVFNTLGRWIKRAFFGTHKELSLMEEEAIQSPMRVIVNKFFHKKLAIVALSLFVVIVGFCFIGSALTDGDEMFLDTSQTDTTPGFNLLSVPSELNKTGVKKIAIGSTYSMGIDINGKVYVWGNSLKDLYEGFVQTTTGETITYEKLDLVTGKYIEVVSNKDILNIKDAIKVINQGTHKAIDVFAGPDSFYLVLDDNSAIGFGKSGDSTSFGSSIINREIMEVIKREGVYNISMDNQVAALITNSDPNGQHSLYFWGNIGVGQSGRSQNSDAIIAEIKDAGLNPIDVKWARDTIVVLFDNGTFKSYGPADSVLMSSQPDNKMLNLQSQINGVEVKLIEEFADDIPGYNEQIKVVNDKIDANAIELVDAMAAQTKAKSNKTAAERTYNKTKASFTSAEKKYNENPDDEELKAEYEELKADLATYEAELEAAIASKDAADELVAALQLEKIGLQSELSRIKTTYSTQIRELAAKDSAFTIQLELIAQYEAELAKNKAILDDITEYGVKQIFATRGGVVALLNNGKIIAWGDNSSNENNVPSEYQGHYVSIEGNTVGAEKCSHVVAMTDDGKIVTWGSTFQNGTKLPKDIESKNVKKIYNNYYQNIAVDEEGHVVAKWGLTGYAFGTDQRGRSIFIRVMHGGKISLTIGLIAVVISSVIGIIVGGVAGFYGGWVDTLMMRLCEIVGSIPFMPIAMTLSLVCNELGLRDTKSKMIMIMLILGILSWTGLASLIRAHILAEREKEFVTAAQAVGVKSNKIIFRHIIPNVITIIIISITSSYAGSLLTESGLSFLGFGVEEPSPTWGNMLTGAQQMTVIKDSWWRWVFPSLFLCATTISINLIGDCIRDAVDPRSTER